MAGMRILPCGIALGFLLATAASGADESRFLARLHGGGYLGFFANQQGEFDEDRYLTEGGLEADIFLYRFTPDTHLVWSITCATGMGEATTSGLPFSVQEVRYALVPFIEHRKGGRLMRFGLDHGCDHLILKDTAQPWYIRNEQQVLRDVYDNRLFAAVGSTSHRRATWRQRAKETDRAAPRWIHYIEVGYFLQELFGLVDEDALNEGNNWWWDLTYDLRCQLCNSEWGTLFASNRLHALLDRDDDLYWRDRIGIEFQPARSRIGSAYQLTWHALDEHPRDSKESLIELTASFFF